VARREGERFAAKGRARGQRSQRHQARTRGAPSFPRRARGDAWALLTRSDLRGLGLERRAIDAVFRALPVVALPGYSRPLIRAEQYLELVEEHTYRDDRVRSCSA